MYDTNTSSDHMSNPISLMGFVAVVVHISVNKEKLYFEDPRGFTNLLQIIYNYNYNLILIALTVKKLCNLLLLTTLLSPLFESWYSLSVALRLLPGFVKRSKSESEQSPCLVYVNLFSIIICLRVDASKMEKVGSLIFGNLFLPSRNFHI